MTAFTKFDPVAFRRNQGIETGPAKLAKPANAEAKGGECILANGHGGWRLGAGRKPRLEGTKGPRAAAILLPDTDTRERLHEQRPNGMGDAGKITAYEVLQANLEFYHFEAEEMRQLIRKLPADGLTDDQQARLSALETFLGTLRFRDKATEVANCLIRFQTRVLAPKPARADEEAPADEAKVINLIPANEKVRDAFRRAAAGLPPMPRKIV